MSTHFSLESMRKIEERGLYDPRFEHDACGVGLVANIKGVRSHDIVKKGIEALVNLGHRGACGADPETCRCPTSSSLSRPSLPGSICLAPVDTASAWSSFHRAPRGAAVARRS